jgi:hypothetical protein
MGPEIIRLGIRLQAISLDHRVRTSRYLLLHTFGAPTLLVHALVPFVFPLWVSTMIQESPSKFFPTASGISDRIPRRTTTLGMASHTMVHRLLKPRTPLDCPLCRLCSSEKNSFGASLHEEVSGPDCLMTKGQSELGLERARRIIHHLLWQYRHRLMVELSPALGASRVHPRMLREDLVDVCESFPSTKPLFSEHVVNAIMIEAHAQFVWCLKALHVVE